MQWINENKEWLFSGLGLTLLSIVVFIIKRFFKSGVSKNDHVIMKQNNKKNSKNIQINEFNLNIDRKEE
ncbi:hypothetical protein [Acetobacterium wieringae]|uniref:hypothetical protein n=1 Tax=Acetobacterium wieringae TaxID=52694 RepID=UPI0026F00272|nr:hypothetical protein [Acetobacterium wieringae]